MLEVDTSKAMDEVIEETIVESNAIVDAIEEAIEEHRVDTEATKKEALTSTRAYLREHIQYESEHDQCVPGDDGAIM